MKSKIKKIFTEKFSIYIVPTTKTNVMFELKSLKRKIVDVHISGISTISRALVSDKEGKKN